MMAISQGADTILDDEDYGFEAEPSAEAAGGYELTHLPVSLGYVEVEKEEVAEPTKMGTTELIESRIAESEAQYIKKDDEED
jgi:hypothetical protein